MSNSVSTRTIRENGGMSEICKPIEEIGCRKDCGYDRNEWRFDGGIEDCREIPWEEMTVCAYSQFI